MSAFVLIVRWNGSPSTGSEIESLASTLSHRGNDGWLIHRGPIATIAVQHSWTTPEDVGVVQPIACEDPEIEIVFDGRLDNRDELLNELGLASWTPISDPELVALCFGRWGRDVLNRAVGPAALSIIDHRRKRVILGRDALGERSIVWAEIPGGLIVASEEQAVLAHPDIPGSLDDGSLARFFALKAPEPGRTFFSAVREVPAGHMTELGRSFKLLTRYWRPEELDPAPEAPSHATAERFRATLAAAVECRLRARSTPAVLMSGGLDSTSVAAHAASIIGRVNRLHTISWVFDELEDADESDFIQSMVRNHRLDASLIRGDQLWPLRDRTSWPCNPNLPYEGLYRSLTRAAYATALEKDTPVILNGEMGDQLFAHSGRWMRDLIRCGRWGCLGHQISSEISRRGLAGSASSLLNAAGRVMRRRVAGNSVPRWCTPKTAELVGLRESHDSPHVRPVVDPFSTFGLARETGTAAAHGVEVRRPYRDRRLVELALSLPAYLMASDGYTKWILREAGRGLLPEPVRLRRRRTSLLPLCARGLGGERKRVMGRILTEGEEHWRPFVRHDWVQHHLAAGFPSDSAESLTVWNCISFSLWYRSFVASTSHRSHTAPLDPSKQLYNPLCGRKYEKTA
jgi:asparagine synthase (glutamine-hydrolysing)